MHQNLFIALEGIDGSGKSTQAKLLADNLIAKGYKVYLTCEPSTGFIGKIIRSILKGERKADARTIAGLFVADRLDHINNKEDGLLNKLAEGYIVITDRYYFSSYAYNGKDEDMDWVIMANSLSASLLRPHVNLFIDVSPQVAMQRINANRNTTELYETIENLEKVRGRYLTAFEKQKDEENIVTINGDNTVETIAADILMEIEKLLNV